MNPTLLIVGVLVGAVLHRHRRGLWASTAMVAAAAGIYYAAEAGEGLWTGVSAVVISAANVGVGAAVGVLVAAGLSSTRRKQHVTGPETH
ncbi:MAG: hypothetical protein QY307_03560 [Acidimicrobiia bacterium]|nr:MAG: hypothetical protein QY307_03560 [Acidimicrobiia bacterium]